MKTPRITGKLSFRDAAEGACMEKLRTTPSGKEVVIAWNDGETHKVPLLKRQKAELGMMPNRTRRRLRAKEQQRVDAYNRLVKRERARRKFAGKEGNGPARTHPRHPKAPIIPPPDRGETITCRRLGYGETRKTRGGAIRRKGFLSVQEFNWRPNKGVRNAPKPKLLGSLADLFPSK